MAEEWWRPLRDLNDRYFAGPAPGIGWEQHVLTLNNRLALTGDHELSTFPKVDLPPSWFIGNVESVIPNDWVLVFSLNPATDPDEEFYETQEWDAERFWAYQAHWLKSWWNQAFHGSLTRLVAYSIEHTGFDNGRDLQNFGYQRLVFAELCPYASRRFALSVEALEDLRETDVGCRVEREMTDRMIREGHPKLILVNGSRAIEHFELMYREGLSWNALRYPSSYRPDRTLWHMQGTLTLGRPIPILGFPFLRKPRTHNAEVEIQQLGMHAANLLRRQ